VGQGSARAAWLAERYLRKVSSVINYFFFIQSILFPWGMSNFRNFYDLCLMFIFMGWSDAQNVGLNDIFGSL
jgi:hypothetical protein